MAKPSFEFGGFIVRQESYLVECADTRKCREEHLCSSRRNLAFATSIIRFFGLLPYQALPFAGGVFDLILRIRSFLSPAGDGP